MRGQAVNFLPNLWPTKGSELVGGNTGWWGLIWLKSQAQGSSHRTLKNQASGGIDHRGQCRLSKEISQFYFVCKLNLDIRQVRGRVFQDSLKAKGVTPVCSGSTVRQHVLHTKQHRENQLYNEPWLEPQQDTKSVKPLLSLYQMTTPSNNPLKPQDILFPFTQVSTLGAWISNDSHFQHIGWLSICFQPSNEKISSILHHVQIVLSL